MRTVTIPKKIFMDWQLKGNIVEFVTDTKGGSSFLKLRNVQVEH